MAFLAVGILSLFGVGGSLGYYLTKNAQPPVYEYYTKDDIKENTNKSSIIITNNKTLLDDIKNKNFKLKPTLISPQDKGITLSAIRQKIQELRPIPQEIRTIITPIQKFEADLRSRRKKLKPIFQIE